MIISHIKQTPTNQYIFQTNDDHSKGVADFAKQFASAFGMGDIGFVLGLLHDKGKEQLAFQQHIKKGSGYEPSISVCGDYHHAYVGGLIAKLLYKRESCFLVNPIMGHHCGLYDYDELSVNEKKQIPSDVIVPTSHEEIRLPSYFNSKDCHAKDIHHLERMLYSCLVDADYLDTERFMNSAAFDQRGHKKSIAELLPLLTSYLSEIKSKATDTDVNRIRGRVQQYCADCANLPQGFYSLTVPTGGGKTLSSLVWAMRHAVHHGLRRIIIAIPYTSIIVQTASILKHIFGEGNVLEHHSNVNIDTIKDENLRKQMSLAMENWDYPIIVTTNVQLFESMMANKPSDCRKLHNIAKSVIILDEVQTLPTEFLQPIVDSLKTYQKLFGVSVLLTTASQPVLTGLIEGCNPKSKFEGIDHVTEIIPAEEDLSNKLKRVKIETIKESQTYEDLAQKLVQHDRVLCIVNTRKDAKELYDRLPDEGIKIHLSRMMCPEHVAVKIQEMREAITNPENKIIRVISTQLIEAGVDIDFPVVYRQEAGLDSILQAAGRCNREGKNEICTTYIFSIKDRLPVGKVKDGNNARQSLNENSDWFAPDTMSEYFRQFYCRTENFDRKGMSHFLYKPSELCFETAAKEFQLIEDSSVSVIVNWGDSMALVERLKQEEPTYSRMKQLSKYMVGVRQSDIKKLLEGEQIEEVTEGVFVASDAAQYDKEVGLLTNNHWLEEIHIL